MTLVQAGLELLKDEWPLCLRLIGLRMTKLKDLQAPEPSSGIKRVSILKYVYVLEALTNSLFSSL